MGARTFRALGNESVQCNDDSSEHMSMALAQASMGAERRIWGSRGIDCARGDLSHAE